MLSTAGTVRGRDRAAGRAARSRSRRVRAGVAAMAVAAVATACQGPPPDQGPDVTAPRTALDIQLDQAFTLAIGDTAALADGALVVWLEGVTEDSRCPVDVTCVWEGDAVVVAGTIRAGQARTHRLHLAGDKGGGSRSVEVGGFRLTLEALAPAPRSEQPIPPEAYRATFRVVHAS